MATNLSATTTNLPSNRSPLPHSENSRDSDPEHIETDNDHSLDQPSDKDSKSLKPRPITSCAPCRIRKVKCNRASPCASCITRQTTSDCTYANNAAERTAISAAETIAELRAKKNKLQAQLARTNANPSFQRGGEREEADEEELAALEAVYAILRRGSLDLAREVVGRVRAGEEVGDVLWGVPGADLGL
ncbi:hypothetical protein BDV12DRAFT_191935 [Aspergillus spectabilis]